MVQMDLLVTIEILVPTANGDIGDNKASGTNGANRANGTSGTN